MSSSLQTIYSITLDDKITFSDYGVALEHYRMKDQNIIQSNLPVAQYELDFGEEWRTHFPDFSEISAMCKEYPALEKAFENFKTLYEIVKDDYANKTRNST